MMSGIDVSIVMAAWNAADHIAPAIRSALSQKDVALELIIIDDASPDETLAAVRRAARNDPRLRLERLQANGGPSAARNRGLELATGRYIAVLDCDDSFSPGRLARLVHRADDTGADIIADNMSRITELGAPSASGTPFLNPDHLDGATWIRLSTYLDPATARMYGEDLGYLKPLFRREILDRTGLRYDTKLRNSEDFYLVAELLAAGARFLLEPSRGYNYLVRPGSISHRLTPDMTRALVEAHSDFSARHALDMNHGAKKACLARAQMLARSHAFERVVAAIKAKRPGGVFGVISSEPANLPHIAGRLMGIGLGKLGLGGA